MCKKYEGDISELSEAERFLVEMYRIPRLVEKLDIFLVVSQAPSSLSIPTLSSSRIRREAPIFLCILTFTLTLTSTIHFTRSYPF